MRITSKGQVTIPERVRRAAGLLPGTEVEFVHDKKGVHLRPVTRPGRPSNRERRIAAALERLRGSATIKMTTEEIMALTRGE
jgi:AbrB family looped-hinge helix DNA binding protein